MKRSYRLPHILTAALLLAGPLLTPGVARAQATHLDPRTVKGPFLPAWNSLKQYQCPDWFRDAKFGIWAHWTAQCVPEQGDWYARQMYQEGSGDYKYQVAHYGHPSKFGFKDIDNLWHAEHWNLSRLGGSHAFFLGSKITVSKEGRVRLEAPMDKIIVELAKLGMVSVGGTLPHPLTYLARCTHNEIIRYYNWVMRGCCTYYSFVDNFYQLTSYLRLAIRSSCVRTLTMKLKRFRSARTYKEFGAECAARYRVPIRNGAVVEDQLPEEERRLLKERMKAAKSLRLDWEELGSIEKSLLQRFIIPKRIQEPNGDVNLEFRGDYLLFCSKNAEHEETKRALRKLELLPPAQNIWDFKEILVPPPRPRLSIDYESLYPY